MSLKNLLKLNKWKTKEQVAGLTADEEYVMPSKAMEKNSADIAQDPRDASGSSMFTEASLEMFSVYSWASRSHS